MANVGMYMAHAGEFCKNLLDTPCTLKNQVNNLKFVQYLLNDLSISTKIKIK